MSQSQILGEGVRHTLHCPCSILMYKEINSQELFYYFPCNKIFNRGNILFTLVKMLTFYFRFDEALLGQIEDAVIIEGEEEVIDLDTSLSSTTTTTDNSVQDVEKLDKDGQNSTCDDNSLLGEQTEETDKRTSWSEQMEEDDSLD